MNRSLQWTSLRFKVNALIASLMIILAGTAAVLYTLVPARIDKVADRWAQNRVSVVARVLARGLTPNLDFGDQTGVREILSGLSDLDGAIYGAVLRPDAGSIGAWQPDNVPHFAPADLHAGFVIHDGAMHIVQPISSPSGTQAFLVLGFSLHDLERDRKEVAGLLGAIGVILLVVGILISFFVHQTLAKPITELAKFTAGIVATGDLTRSIAVGRDDEIGVLAQSVGEIVNQQRSMLTRIQQLITGISSVVSRVSAAGGEVGQGMGVIQERVEETSVATRHMLVSLRSIGEDVEALAHSADDSSSSLIEMASSNREVADNTTTMATSAQSTSVAVQRMATSVGEIARSIEQLNGTLNETSSSMQRMDSAIEEVERNANETARLSEQVLSDAEMGVGALQKTLEGIETIRQSSQSAAGVIASLGEHIQEIGAILQVIDEVAAQTKLLSLNAAIIASQAGEHGRGFSVVADQIKELAQRTGASTREISHLIHNIQEESRNATAAMGRGVESVEAGILLGYEAAGALTKITDSAHASTAMMRKIAQATLDQTRGTKQITLSIERILHTVGQISTYSQEQARGAEQIIDTSKGMHLLTEQVRMSSEEQATGSRQVIKSMQTIADMVNRLNTAQRDQTGNAELVQAAVEEIRNISQGQTAKLSELETALNVLTSEATELKGELRKFKV